MNVVQGKNNRLLREFLLFGVGVVLIVWGRGGVRGGDWECLRAGIW